MARISPNQMRQVVRKIKGGSRLQKGLILLFVVAALVLWALNKAGILQYKDLYTAAGLRENPASDEDFSIQFLDVGQGDSTLVICGEHAMLIDAGEVDKAQSVVNYIKNQNVEKLDYVIDTHQHSDHIGGMQSVLENFEVDKIIMPKMPDELVPTTYVYENLLTEIKSQRKKITAATDTHFSLGDATVETFTAKGDYDDLNNYSVFVKITFGGTSFLITGDGEKAEEKELLAQEFDLSATVLKVGHHGSNTSTSDTFLAAVNPQYAVISVGEGNSYGHPADAVVQRLKDFGTEVYRTDLQGAVVMESDGETVQIKTEKSESS